jgi:hypothetical protein
MAGFKTNQFLVMKYEYEVSIKNDYKLENTNIQEEHKRSKRHMIMNERFCCLSILNDKKYYVSTGSADKDFLLKSSESVRDDCRDHFQKIACDLATFPPCCCQWFEINGRTFYSSIDCECYVEDCHVSDWVEGKKTSEPPDYLDKYYAIGHYDSCWQWSVSVFIAKSGEYSKFQVRNILLILNNKKITKVQQLHVLCYLGIMSNNCINPIEGAIEPY